MNFRECRMVTLYEIMNYACGGTISMEKAFLMLGGIRNGIYYFKLDNIQVIGTGGAISGNNLDSITVSTDFLLKSGQGLTVMSFSGGGSYYEYTFVNTDLNCIGASSATSNINCIRHIVGIKGTT